MLRNWVLGATILAAVTAFGCASEVGNDGAIVGGSCVVSSECHATARCLTGASWPNGYCASSCDTSEDCPGGSVCVEAEGGICVVECASAGDCRTDEESGVYECVAFEVRGAGGTAMGCGL